NGSAFPYHSARQAAAVYLDLGLAPVPVPKRQKRPVLDRWPELQVTPTNLHEYFPDDRSVNLGVILRSATRIADVDLDCNESVAAGARWLPKTAWVSGRAGNERSHYWYRPIGAVTYRKFEDVDDSLLLELRAGDGYQTIAPPGTHESGDEITWHTF